MIYILAILIGALGAGGGWVTGVMAAAAAGIGNAGGGMTAFSAAGPLSAVAGFLLAVVLTLYVKGDVRTFRGLAVRSLAVVVMAGALAACVFGLRSAALAHLGLIAKAPAVEFEIRLPSALAADIKGEAQVELLTDLNQTLAQLDSDLRATGDGRAVLRGHVPLKFRTSERMVVLNLPGQMQRAFKLRLPANPSPSDEFGPWHMVDHTETAGLVLTPRGTPDDSFAIRYRVL